MNDDLYKSLKKRLQKIEKAVVKAHIKNARGPWKARVKALHAAAETGGAVDAFGGVLARRSAVQFLLRTVYVRVMEDLELLPQPFIRGQRGYQAFRAVAPTLGMRAYLGWVFRDLAVDFPELFAPRDDELPLPDEALCQQVWDLWHDRDAQNDTLIFDWTTGEFDSRFLGDLYQDLDAEVRDRYALFQTPDFVESYILDKTLTPAIDHFDPAAMRARGERFRIIDPTCGSGHFLIGAFRRLADYWKGQGFKPWAAVEAALEGVWGCDLNPHAVHVAHVRLLLEVVARTGERDWSRLRSLALNLRVMDSLIPWEGTPQGHQDDAFADELLARYGEDAARRDFQDFLRPGFQAVVGNPPYVSPKDAQKRADYRRFWPRSANGQYGLSAPFIERFLTLGVTKARVGLITSNAFYKKDYGESLVHNVLPKWNIESIVDTSVAFIPHHGTPTVILFAEASVPTAAQHSVTVLGGKQGEPSEPRPASSGRVWQEILAADTLPDGEGRYISVIERSRDDLQGHPWNLNGGGALEVQRRIEQAETVVAREILRRKASGRVLPPGRTTVAGGDSIWSFRTLTGPLKNFGGMFVECVRGEDVRDYSFGGGRYVLWPYDGNQDRIDWLPAERFLWTWRYILGQRKSFGRTLIAKGLPWWSHLEHYPDRLVGNLGVSYPCLSTHAQFVLDRERRAFDQKAPVIKLRAGASEQDYLSVLGILNSSTMQFWMKQVFFDRGYTGGGAFRGVDWELFFEFDATTLSGAPLCNSGRGPRVALARDLDATAQERAACLPAALLAANGWTAQTLPAVLAQGVADYQRHTHRMVALQEELDWLTYQSYGLLKAPTVRTPATIEPMAPGHRPFEIVLAKHNADCDPDERSAWFSRHGHAEVTALPHHYSAATKALVAERLALIEEHKEIRLIEQPQFKRRWQLADFEKAAHKAAGEWLLDRLEDLFAPARAAEGDTPARLAGPLADAYPYRLDAIVNAWQRDPRVQAVAGVYTGDANFDLSLLAEQLLTAEGIPDNIFRVYSDEGLRKLRKWQEVWRLQDREDAGETVKIEKPPEFKKGDFINETYFKIRGKLNVPRERFIVFADVHPPRYGWNGWRDTERALTQLDAFAAVEGDPTNPLPAPSMDDPRRCGATVGLWESLPDVKRWGDVSEHAQLRRFAEQACNRKACPCDVKTAWQEWRAGTRAIVRPEGVAPTISLEARSQVMALVKRYQPEQQLDLLSADEAPKGKKSKKKTPGAKLSALKSAWLGSPTDLDQVLEALEASGDLARTGKGKNRQYFVNQTA